MDTTFQTGRQPKIWIGQIKSDAYGAASGIEDLIYHTHSSTKFASHRILWIDFCRHTYGNFSKFAQRHIGFHFQWIDLGNSE